jgi:uncharacterized OB-fold protein
MMTKVSTMAERSLPAPAISPETEVFWQAAEQGRLLLRRCTACGRTHWYPRAICPHCLGDTEWEEAAGVGTIYSYTVMRRAAEPYVVAYVTLDAGPTMLTNIVGCDFDQVRIGQRVRLAWVPTEGGPPMPCFTLM